MTAERKRNITYWLLKIGSIIISVLLPVWAICVKFPVWQLYHGNGKTIGVGAILILFVVIVVFRKTVVKFIVDKFKIKHMPPVLVWLILLMLAYGLQFISQFLPDIIIVLWMGVVGGAIGALMTFVAEQFFGKKEKSDGSGA